MPSKIELPASKRSSLLFVGLILLGCFGPVSSMGQWDRWDEFRWGIKVIVWAIVLIGWLLFYWILQCRPWLRYIPMVSAVVAVVAVLLSASMQKLATDLVATFVWSVSTGVLFLYLRSSRPELFVET
jgi:hypothetical protein